MIKKILLLIIFTFYFSALVSTEAKGNLHLLSNVFAIKKNIKLSNDEKLFLENKKIITLGVVSQDYSPFDITTHDGYYEGITADVTSIIRDVLGREILIHQFANRTQALAALQNKDIDFLSTATEDENRGDFVLSHPYVTDYPTLYHRVNDDRVLTQVLKYGTIAMKDGDIALDALKNQYPQIRVKLFPTQEQALASMAFGHSDLYIGKRLSTSTLINENYYNLVKIATTTTPSPPINIGFAIRFDNNTFLSIVNKVIDSIPDEQMFYVYRHWTGINDIINSKTFMLTKDESDWIHNHPIIRASISSDQAPVAFFDVNNNLGGVVSDIFQIIMLKTGLVIQTNKAPKISDLTEKLKNHETDLSVLSPSENRKKILSFSHPFYSNPFGIIVNKDNNHNVDINYLSSKTISLPKGHFLLFFLRKDFPSMKIIETDTLFESMKLVEKKKADATFADLSIANLYVLQYFSGSLKITNIFDRYKSPFTFAIRSEDVMLLDIINKVLLTISPDEMNIIATRWRTNSVIRQQSWRDYRSDIFMGILIVLIPIIVSLIWNNYLRRQVVKRQLAESKLNEQMIFKDVLINGVPHPIYVRDYNGKLTACNKSFLSELGVDYNDVIGQNVLDSLSCHLSNAEEMNDYYFKVINDNVPVSIDHTLLINGNEKTIFHWIQPYKYADGKIQGVICGWIDITERRSLLEQLQMAKSEADSANRAKTNFLATMSHEIRTPMSAVIGMLELVLNKAKYQQFDFRSIELAFSSANSLQQLIGDILDISRIEAGHMVINPMPVDIRKLILSVIQVFDGLARQKNISLEFVSVASNRYCLILDPIRVKQMISNLISNAIKFTDKGIVTVYLELLTLESNKASISIIVQDSGIGISDDDINGIFDPFTQANHSDVDKRSGTGLGLSICKSIINEMGGDIHISSKLGQGTRVMLSACLEMCDIDSNELNDEKSNDVTISHSALRVLVVDDHDVNRIMLVEQLKFLGHSAQEAINGQDALEKWGNEFFDTVITDCNMPIMNGYNLSKHIRNQEVLLQRDRCVILGLTANALPDEKLKCLQSGMDDCLFKPLSMDVLNSALIMKNAPNAREADITTSNSYDLSAISKLSAKNRSIKSELINKLISSNDMDLQAAIHFLNNSDWERLSEIAHKIKGGVSIISATDIKKQCVKIESLTSNSSKNIPEIRKAVDELSVLLIGLKLKLEFDIDS